MGVGVGGVQVLQDPANGRLRRQCLPRLQTQGLQVGGGQVGGVLPDGRQAPAACEHSVTARDRTANRLWRTPRRSRGSPTFLRTWARGWHDRTVMVEYDMAA